MTPDFLNSMHIVNIIIGIVAVAVLCIIAAVLLMMRASNNMEEDEFPPIGSTINPNDPNWFHSFDVFKNKVNKIEKKDDKTKTHLDFRKNNYDSDPVNIYNSGRDRKSNSESTTSDIQSD